MSRRKRHEEHLNHEAWAIPYGDLLTLLLAFFVVMYSMSTVNEGKFRVLGETLNAEFRGKPTTISPIQVGDQQLGPGSKEDASVIQKPITHVGTHTSSDPSSEQANQADPKRQKVLDQVANGVESALSSLIHDKLVTIRRHDLWVEVELQTDFLYPSGSATLSPIAEGVLAPLAESLRPFKNPIRVEGYTDNIPIKTLEYKSNWELSAARAASVVHTLSSSGVNPSQLTVIGHGEYQPIASNSTVEGRNANRRVVVVILNLDNANADANSATKASSNSPGE
jgi:chemotaxis protein MotB